MSERFSIASLRESATRKSPPLMLTDQAKLLALVDAVEAARELLDLAGVAHNGDPWYAEHEGLDGDAILQRGSDVLARFDFGEPA